MTDEAQRDDQVFYRRQEEVEDAERSFNDTAEYEGEDVVAATGGEPPRIEDLTELELREGETDDPNIAAEEGLTYIPPTDPPVVPDQDDPQGARVAAGFGSTADDEPYDMNHESELISDEDEVVARIRDALRADASTSVYAENLAIAHRGGLVGVRGVVDDLDDTDNIVDVIGRVTGVVEVRDELEVRGVTD